MSTSSVFVVLLLAACATQCYSYAPIRSKLIQYERFGASDDHATPLQQAWWSRHHAGHSKSPECMWLNYTRHDNVKAWEFQAQPHRHMVIKGPACGLLPVWLWVLHVGLL